MDNFIITGKVAIITGASRGIGQAIAETYADVGAKLVISSRKKENLEIVEKILKDKGADVLAIPCHTGDQAAIDALVTQTTDSFGNIDILVNNAATNPHFGPLLTSEESHWDKILDVNIKGYFRMVKAVVPSMSSHGGGKIVNIASIAGMRPDPGMGIYSVSKAGVIMLTKVLAVELAQEKIQVNAIAPGFIKTKFSSAIWSNEVGYEMLTKVTPLKRLGEPKDVSDIALYLASPASNFVTGSIFIIDGGLSIAGFESYYQ